MFGISKNHFGFNLWPSNAFDVFFFPFFFVHFLTNQTELDEKEKKALVGLDSG